MRVGFEMGKRMLEFIFRSLVFFWFSSLDESWGGFSWV